jgi:3-hydroxyacyl-[acyl-carrier-protein] dehydratase
MRLEYFQLIDRVVTLNLAEKTVDTEAVVPTESTMFEGHFSVYPLMPAALLIESMAQTSGWLLVALNRFERWPYLASLKEVNLRTFVNPGARLSLSAKLLHDGSGFAVTESECRNEGKIVCDATISFRLMPPPGPEFITGMRKVAKDIALPKEAAGDG